MASHLRIQAPRPPPPASLGMKGPPCRAPWAAPTRNFSLRGSAKLPSVHAAPDVSFFIIQNSFSPHISSFHLHDTYFVCPDSFRLQNRVSRSPQSVWLPPFAATYARSALLPAAFSCHRPPLSHTHIRSPSAPTPSCAPHTSGTCRRSCPRADTTAPSSLQASPF